ncbi:unnamed protein product [Euphydryas editha]|uniref:Uncharacterized protein n=1 Tax=Euphydryas editha TaxID=104508 RepID=A0AAU9V7G4_EUPED|nr:unnamed protein product [Euphydryas editha]
MPERSKKRKNNKNKRKNNKNNRSDTNKSNVEEKESISIESRSNISKEDVSQNNAQIVKECSENQLKPSEGLPLNVYSNISAPVKIQKYDDVKKEEKSHDSLVFPTYIVETPEKPNKIKSKLDNGKKSKSCDNDDSPTIVEITEDITHSDQKVCAPIVDSSNVIISHEDSDIEWENVDDFKLPKTEFITGVLSSTTIPLNIAHCEHTKTLSPEEESSLRNYLQTLNLSTNSTHTVNTPDIQTEIEKIINREIKYRLRRKGFAEDNIYPRAGPSRSLAVIDEEASSGSSKTSRRHSYLSDKKSDNEELEDEVFESKQAQIFKSGNTDSIDKISSKHLIPQQCIRVDAKLKEPEISEARGDWTVQTIEKMTGAELVYLTDSSSSTSSIYDANDDFNKGEETDTSVRIITPTIEVTDTETLLSSTFVAKTNNKDVNKQEENVSNDTESVSEQILNNTHSSSDIKKCEFSNADSHLNCSPNEIVILSTDNLETNLYVKDLEEHESKVLPEKYETNTNDDQVKLVAKSPKDVDEYDLEIKVLKCELNDAINNLINEVISDSENSNENLKRQDSSSSVDSSQCTAKYNPTNSSLNDISNLIQDEGCENINNENKNIDPTFSHVKDVLQCVTSKTTPHDKILSKKNVQPLTLRDTCLKKITSLPFGDKILEELANVSQRLQKTVLASQSKEEISNTTSSRKDNSQIPPPIQPRKSSLKISQDEQNKPILPPRIEPVYECLSPSQKMLMEKMNIVISKDDIAKTVETYGNKTDRNVKNVHDMSIIGDSLEKTQMKSKTGCRLLALLRNTSNSSKLNSPSLSSTNLQAPKVKFNTESYSKKLIEEIDSAKVTNLSDDYKSLPPSKSENSSSYFYESDSGIKENSFRSLRNNKKYFHYSTGNLNQEIESDISSIQNMHRYCTNLRDQKRDIAPRRPSLPKDLCDQQMEYICQKEKEVDAEIRRLEQAKNKTLRHRGPRAPMFSEKEKSYDQIFNSTNRNYIKNVVRNQNPTHTERRKLSSLFSSSEEELLREKMYSEYVSQIAEREQRKQHKVIKITQTPPNINAISKSMPTLESLNSMNNPIEQEFISKAKERWYKLGIKDPETEDEQEKEKNVYREPKIIEHKIKVIESGEEKDVKKLPTHMQEFVKFTVNDKDNEKCSTGESDSEQTSAHVVIFCAVVIFVLTVSKFLLRLFR